MDWNSFSTPCYIVDEKKIIKNLEILKSIVVKTNCKILLAQKAFSMYSLYGLIGKYLNGVSASSLFEAKLGFEEMQTKKEVHTFSPAYKPEEIEEILKISTHVIFNSFNQWKIYRNLSKKYSTKFGLRVNPEYSEVKTKFYNPCSKGSRLGITLKNFQENELNGISGFHFHTMCEQDSFVLKRTLNVFEEKFGAFLKNMEWVNFGGGHHITKNTYDINELIKCIEYFQNKYDVRVYLEPGEAVALDAGYLVSKVLDIVNSDGIKTLILDTSAACHMPDVLEMPYKPRIINCPDNELCEYKYRLSSISCLAGDIIGDYSFKKVIKINDIIIFCDMLIYTMVKNNMFNGINLPDIVIAKEDSSIKVIKKFGYEDYKSRL